ncbi:TPA: hypothetical protein ACMD15_003410 [Vibrio cholerae]
MNWKHYKKFVVVPTLKKIGLYSEAAANLIVGTAAQESNGHHLIQLNGVALGFIQMEPATYTDIWDNFLSFKPELEAKISHLASIESTSNGLPPDKEQLITNLAFSVAMCRAHYLRKREPLPNHDDVEGMAKYWKEHYNTHKGKGTPEEFIKNFPIEIID